MIMLEAQEEVMGCNKDQAHVIKGKRTKRQRPQSPLALAMVSTSSSPGGEGEGDGDGERFSDNSGVMGASPTTSVEFATSTEEEEDMANCLILLAQGNTKKLTPSSPTGPISTTNYNNSNNNVVNTSSKVPGLYVYQCKTCNRCFPSFQALGGHRASHKKPKAVNNEEKKTLVTLEDEDFHDHDHHHHQRFNHMNMNTTLSLQIADRPVALSTASANNKANKVHECSICGAEFSSGQALGGHMRRHRAFMSSTTTSTTTTTALSVATSGSLDHHQHNNQSREAKKSRNILQLDLNLPAPEDDRRESKFAFASKEQVIVFSASSLVDCHY